MADPKALETFVTQYPDFASRRNDGQLEIIFNAAERRTINPGETLYRANEPVKFVYLIESGSVLERQNIQDPRTGPRVVTRTRLPGKFLGLYDLIYQRDHSTTATAQEEAVVIELRAQETFRLLYNYPALRQSLIPFKFFNRLQTVPFLAGTTPTVLGFLAESADYMEADANHPFYKSGDPAEFIYIVDVGQVRLKYDTGEEIWIGNSQPFGLLDTPANIVGDYAVNHAAQMGCMTQFFRWKRQEFIEITGLRPERLARSLHQETRETLDKLSLFSKFSSSERDHLLGYMSHYFYPQPDLLLQQGEFASSVWILMPRYKGMMYSTIGGELQKSGVIGDAFFNENVLRAQVPCSSTLQAEPGSQWLRLHAEDYRKFVANEPDKGLADKLAVPNPSATLISKIAPSFDFPLLPGESVELLARRHWVAFLQKILAPFILFAIIVIVWSSITVTGIASWMIDVPVLIMLLLSGLWMLWGWVDYRNDYFLVTNMRVAQVEKVVFFSESRVTALLEQVRDVRFQENTFWQKFWHYGTIFVQTAGKSQISFNFLQAPGNVAAKINQLSLLRAEHYVAGGKREIYNALERQLGLKLDTPDRVWQNTPSKAKAASRSWWRFFFSTQTRDQYLSEQKADRVVWRKHWVVLLGMTITPIIFSLFSTVATLGLILYYISGAAFGFAALAIPIGIFSMFCWTWLWWSVQDWYNDTYEVTDTEIIDTEMSPLFFPIYFDRNVRRAALSDINDISYTIPGPLNIILNMGSVYAETAAQVGRFTFDRVKNPMAVADEIRRRIENFYERQRTAENRRRAQEFPVWFEMYERLGREREDEIF